MPRRAASRQSSRPSSTVATPSSPEGTTWLWTSTNGTASTVPAAGGGGGSPGQTRPAETHAGLQLLLGAQVEPERGRVCLELAEGVRLELAHALAGDAEQPSDLLERSRATRR